MALQNASSMASLVLTTDCMITDAPAQRHDPESGPTGLSPQEL